MRLSFLFLYSTVQSSAARRLHALNRCALQSWSVQMVFNSVQDLRSFKFLSRQSRCHFSPVFVVPRIKPTAFVPLPTQRSSHWTPSIAIQAQPVSMTRLRQNRVQVRTLEKSWRKDKIFQKFVVSEPLRFYQISGILTDLPMSAKLVDRRWFDCLLA